MEFYIKCNLKNGHDNIFMVGNVMMEVMQIEVVSETLFHKSEALSYINKYYIHGEQGSLDDARSMESSELGYTIHTSHNKLRTYCNQKQGPPKQLPVLDLSQIKMSTFSTDLK